MLSIPCEHELVLIRAGPYPAGIGKNTFSRPVAAPFVPEIMVVCRNCAITPGMAGAVEATWLSFLWSIVICQDPFDLFRAQTGELNRP